MWRISTALVVLFAASWAYADSPPTDRIIIDVITVNGTGCPAGTAAVSVLPDNTGFTLSYAAYTAQVGVGDAQGRVGAERDVDGALDVLLFVGLFGTRVDNECLARIKEFLSLFESDASSIVVGVIFERMWRRSRRGRSRSRYACSFGC